MPSLPQFPPGAVPTAQQRAAMNLAQRYGDQAAQQINQLQQQSGTPRPSNIHSTQFPKIEEQKPPLSSLPAFSSTLPQISRSPVNPTQMDGAGDSLVEWKAEIARRRELAAQNPGQADRLFREHLVELQQRLEGGGLMLPLGERPLPFMGTKRKPRNMIMSEDDATSTAPLPAASSLPNSLSRAQADAAADEDADGEVDEDAINSDLDDPDQHEDDENNEENTDQIMLCTYDKVQRVKNKWKCTLKDGVVKVGSAE